MVEGFVSELVVAELRAWVDRLTANALRSPGADHSERLARIAVLEDLRCAVAAAQAADAATLVAERAAAVEREIATVPRPGVGSRRRREEAQRRVVADVARARRVSAWQASRFVAFARAVPADLPLTFVLMATGRLSERSAASIFQAVAPLSPEQRRAVDAELAADLPGWGDRRVDQAARAAVYRTDPAGTVRRRAYATEQRRVSVRPAPECMAWVTTLTSRPQAVAVRAACERAATEARAAGDGRTRGQVMADTVVERVTGVGTAGAVPVAVQLVMTDRTLLGGDEPARFADGEPVAAPFARELVLGRSGETPAARSVRRLFTDPVDRLVTAETRARTFTDAQAGLVKLRDGLCATPWCDAPVRAVDHVVAHTHGGPTSLPNARGLCTWCNTTKGARDDVATSPPPPARPGRAPRSQLERRVRRRVGRRARRAARAPRGRPAVVVEQLSTHRC